MVTGTRRQAVGAHYGLGDWLMQRITALAIGVYVIALLCILLLTPGLDLAHWQSISRGTFFRIATFVALVATFLHAWVGMRDIIMDYVRPTLIRLTLEVLVIFALVAYTGWSIQILWGGR
jgi:succinate dehydrogenase / fumarate reductase membrane anchor subunit